MFPHTNTGVPTMNRTSRIGGNSFTGPAVGLIRALILGLAPAVFMFAGLEFASAQAWPGPAPAVYVPMCHASSCPNPDTSGHEWPCVAQLEGRLMPERCGVPQAAARHRP